MQELLLIVPRSFTRRLREVFSGIDWSLLGAVLLVTTAGLVTMNSFGSENAAFNRQIVWLGISLFAFFILSAFDFHFLRRTSVIVSLYGFSVALLVALVFMGVVIKGAQSWFHFGIVAFEPSDPAKLALVAILAKYFSRRHVEIAHIRHILVSGFYAFLIFALVFIQPDFGAAIIVFLIWFGMVLVSGISKKHFLSVLLLGVLSFSLLWAFAFQPYQKERILTFLHPLTDIHGAGYNAYQSTIAVGSGEIFGKGIGYGTQSRLQFLPEYKTDFIFAAFAEEWGFIGVIVLFGLFGFIIFRILRHAMRAESNFEAFFASGLAVLFLSHFIIHVGINVGLLPVTGTTLPFMSYGGSHLLTEFVGLGILMGMNRYGRAVHRDDMKNEFLGA